MTSQEVQVLPEAGRPDTTKSLALSGGLTLDEIKSVGTLFWQSGMFKDTKSAAQAITKVMAGQELGIPPMQSMRGIHVVDGNPQLSAGLVAALIKRSGRYDYRIVEASDSAVVLEWTQDGNIVGQSDFTLAEAKTAGLAAKANWKTYTEDMLFARALTRGARRYCPDVFGGAVYAPGEAAPEAEDVPQYVQQTPSGYVPPRFAVLHEESRPASEGGAAAHGTSSMPAQQGDADGTHLFPPTDAELEEYEAQHRDPAA